MEITWDEPKRITNKAKHGFDFVDLTEEFFDAATILAARRDRRRAVGEFDGAVVTVIYKPLGREGLSVISMRYATRKERNQP